LPDSEGARKSDREAEVSAELRCDFCSKPRSEVRYLFGGEGIHVCYECVGRSVGSFASEPAPDVPLHDGGYEDTAEPFPQQVFALDGATLAVLLDLPVPPHPNTTFDDVQFKDVVAHSFSLSLAEKLKIIRAAGRFSQEQVDELFTTLVGEGRRLAEILRDSLVRREEQIEKRRRERDAFEAKDGRPDPTDRQPDGSDKALLLRLALDDLLRPLGPGKAARVMRSFLSRLADEIEGGGETSVMDVLPVLFQNELRDPSLN